MIEVHVPISPFQAVQEEHGIQCAILKMEVYSSSLQHKQYNLEYLHSNSGCFVGLLQKEYAEMDVQGVDHE